MFDLLPRTAVRPFSWVCLLVPLVGCQADDPPNGQADGPSESTPESSAEATIVASGLNMERIGAAILNYSARLRVPKRYEPTADGQPGLSWRVSILPQLGFDDLYQEFNLDEPWDSPHNLALVPKMPSVYRSPRGDSPEGHTHYLAVTGPKGFLLEKGRSGMAGVRDGMNSSIAVVEANDSRAVVWTSPKDFQWEAASPAEGLRREGGPGILVIMVDSSVQLLPNTIAAADLAGMYTVNGSEVVEYVKELPDDAPNPNPRTHWGRRHHFRQLRDHQNAQSGKSL